MKSVIYKMGTFTFVKTLDNVSYEDLKDDEDFMPVEVWNQSTDKETFPTIED